ncbi:hypothetical protein [Nocardia goodfellowii]|uniref:Mce-associated membrane protein n=1 Tax=Nocardia goodfellowii TaxID=882446 RepID=A0ABS4QB14_9NOCA|nr:hypothetical protein [Nocardia goodfellowii]MBP2188274.1 Mce-associated membrane protein [Nocardia goodfellowii]
MSKDDADTNKDAEVTEKVAAADEAATEKIAATDKDKAAEPVEAETAAVTAKPDLAKKPAEAAGADVPKASDSSTGSERRSSNLVPVIAAFAAGILLVAAATAVTMFYLQASKKSDELAAIDTATKTACAFGRDVSTYDYSKDLPGYFSKVKEGATGEFLKEFDDASKALNDAMVQAQVKSWTDNVECGYQSGDTSQAKVLVTLANYRTNFTQANPDRQYVAIVADLQYTDGKWKVSKLDSPMLKGAGAALPGTTDPGPQANTPAPAPSGEPAPGN